MITCPEMIFFATRLLSSFAKTRILWADCLYNSCSVSNNSTTNIIGHDRNVWPHLFLVSSSIQVACVKIFSRAVFTSRYIFSTWEIIMRSWFRNWQNAIRDGGSIASWTACRHCLDCLHCSQCFHRLGKGPATKSDESSEEFQTAFHPPSFLENHGAHLLW